MFIAIDILFEKRKIRREKKVEAALDEKNFDEIIVFPMAIPFIAGPSTLATIILLMGNYSDSMLISNVSYFCFNSCINCKFIFNDWNKFYNKIYTPQILHATSRVFAFILAALATQFIIDGIKASFNI